MPKITTTSRSHSTLAGGIPIWPRTGTGARGTLTAVARRTSDNAKVLVTCAHVVSTGTPTLYHIHNEGVGEVMYHGGTSDADKIGELYVERDANNAITFRSWSVIQSGFFSNPPDVAALRILNNTSADLGVHFPNDDDDNHTHSFRPIVAPSVDPQEGMSVIRLGSTTGQRTVPISDITPPEPVTLWETDPDNSSNRLVYRFPIKEHFVLDHYLPDNDRSNYSKDGDSGAPLLWEDEEGNLRLVGIHFDSDAQLGKAIPASLVESHLQVYFGVKAPSAVAKYHVGNVVSPPTVRPGDLVTLDGSGSSAKEPGARPLTYQWEQDFGSAHAAIASRDGVTLSSDSAVSPTFTAPAHTTTLKFKLTVTDSYGAKASDTVIVRVVNRVPVAKPGLNRVVNVNSPVTLVGGAEDPDIGHVQGMAYEWSFVEGPSSNAGSSARSTTGSQSSKVMLTTPTENGKLQPHKGTFTPNAIGDYVFTLTVTDPGRLSHSDTMRVKAVRESENLLPTNVSALPGYRSVDISWSGVSLATGYEVQVGVAEDGGEIGYKSYTTTALTHRVENLADGTRYYYRVRMTNADGVGPWSAVVSTVTAVPANHVPVANAGADQTVKAGATVTLDGSGSSDRDGDDLTYGWTQRAGPTVTLSSATAVSPTFTAPSSAAELRFRLTVTDEHGMKAINAVIITVTAPTTEPTPEPTPDPPTTPEITPPTGITATATANSVTVSWKAVSGATGYILQLGELGEDEMVAYGDYTTTKLTHTVSNLASSTRYYYRVKSKKAEVVSSPSAEASLVTPAMTCEDTGETRNVVNGDWTNTGRVQQDPVDDSWEKGQRRTVTWEKEQRCTNCAAGTPNKWVDASRTETRWVAYTPPPKHVWTWVDPAEYTGCGPTRRRRKECSNGHARHTKLVSASEPLIWSEWSDTGDTRDSDIGSWSDDGNTRGCGPGKKKRQSRTISRQKKQQSTNQCDGSKTQWIPTTSRTETQWVDAPEDLIWDDWKNVGQPVIVYGSWTNVGSPSLIAGTCKQRQKRTWTRSQRQQSTNQCGGTRFKSVTTEGATYRYDTVTETWGRWTDTGRTREDPITFIVEYEQERFSSPCNRRQTRWEPETG